jgi:hypothetical protein
MVIAHYLSSVSYNLLFSSSTEKIEKITCHLAIAYTNYTHSYYILPVWQKRIGNGQVSLYGDGDRAVDASHEPHVGER